MELPALPSQTTAHGRLLPRSWKEKRLASGFRACADHLLLNSCVLLVVLCEASPRGGDGGLREIGEGEAKEATAASKSRAGGKGRAAR